MTIADYTFTGDTASQLIRNVWAANTPSASLELCRVLETIQVFVIQEELCTGFDATLNHEPTMLDLLDWLEAVKHEYDFPFSIEK